MTGPPAAATLARPPSTRRRTSRGCPTRRTRLIAILALLALPAPRAGGQEAERWSLFGSLSASYSTNVFLTPVAEFGDTIGGGYLSLAWSRTRREYDLAVSGWVFGAAFSEFRTLSGLNASARDEPATG